MVALGPEAPMPRGHCSGFQGAMVRTNAGLALKGVDDCGYTS
jgi:hypothetical protein